MFKFNFLIFMDTNSGSSCYTPSTTCTRTICRTQFLLLLEIETTTSIKNFTLFLSERVPCEPDPCKNGQCIAHLDGTYFCNCYPGYTGRHCNGQLPAKFIFRQINQIIYGTMKFPNRRIEKNFNLQQFSASLEIIKRLW